VLPNYQLQLYASNFWVDGNFNVMMLEHSDTPIGRIDSVVCSRSIR
jgi:hypothetical protein